jgi:hypothetical protein
VRAVISDYKLPVDQDANGTRDFYVPNLVNLTDFYSGGSLMPGRSYSSTPNYRYGFNSGSEKDDEIYGIAGSLYTTEFRELDTRLGGRWWSPDPIVKPWESPYAGFANNPIYFSDPMGLTAEESTDKNGSGTRSPDPSQPESFDPEMRPYQRASGINLPEVVVSERRGNVFNKIGNFFANIGNKIADIFSFGIIIDDQRPSESPVSNSVKKLPKNIVHISGASWDFLSGTFVSKTNPYGKKTKDLFNTNIDKTAGEKPEEDNASLTAPGQNTAIKIVNSKDVQKQTEKAATQAHGLKPDTVMNIWGVNPTQPKDKNFIRSTKGDTLIYNPDGSIENHPLKK